MSHEDSTTQHRIIGTSKSPLKFFLLVLVPSIPFWLVGFLDLPKILPINLPISAMMFVCPMVAALMLVHQDNEPNGMMELLKRTFDFKRIKNKIWYAPILLLMPVVMLLSYGMMRLLEMPLPEPYIPFYAIPFSFLAFFIGAISEEIGWTGYITEPLQERWGALVASIILGTVWALWHIIPWFQGYPNPEWVIWQCAATVALRILIVWLHNNTGKSVFAAILFHTTINVSIYMFPNYGSGYDPFITFIILAIAASIVTFLWDSETLARYRYTSPRSIKEE